MRDTMNMMFKRYWCLVLASAIYVLTLICWFRAGEDTDVLWCSIVNYGLLFPVCGIILGIHYGRCDPNVKWILPLCAYLGVMIHDVLVGYALFGKVEVDPGQIPMYLITAVPCAAAEILTHFITAVIRNRRRR